jgi:Cdc6-like AAA superfamily ATPase
MILTELLDRDVGSAIEEFLNAFAVHLDGVRPDHYVKDRPDGPFLVIQFAKPSQQHFKIHNRVVEGLGADNPFKNRSSVQARDKAPKDRLTLPETQLLKKVISESLTIDRNSFNENFFSRYTASVTALEHQITTNANFVVYGRRGAGKSSLLSYAMHTTIKNNGFFSWVAMQPFSSRSDDQVVPAVISSILFDLSKTSPGHDDVLKLIKEFDILSESDEKNVLLKCDRLILRVRRAIAEFATTKRPFTIFLDDIHVLAESIQPLVLSYIYKFGRGNNTFIKMSGITQLTNLWDGTKQIGLQPPHDAQILNLDLNLTMPNKSKEHIFSILDAHARYCGIPNIRYLADDNVLSRLVLVAAGVPRDSLSLFSVAISKAAARSQKLVSITSINSAASENAEEKLKDVEKDSGDDVDSIKKILEQVQKFCISEKKVNSFLFEIKNTEARYKLIQKLIALRLLHLLHEGITPHRAGKRFIALMLDFGFYVGIRTARNIDFVPPEPRELLAKELRSLPIFH